MTRTPNHLIALGLLAAVLASAPAMAAHDHTSFDLDEDDHEDLVYQEPKTGIVRLTTVSSDGLRGTSSRSLGGRTTSKHYILGTGDFDADGKTDLLWWKMLSSTSGRPGFWYVNRGSYTHDRSMEADTNLPTLDPNIFDLAAVGDFNGDGTSDLIFHRRNTTGSNPGGVVYWTINTNGTIKHLGTLANAPYDQYDLVGAGDFDDDGVSDILFHNKQTGIVAYWHLEAAGNGVKLGPIGNLSTTAVPYSDWRIVGIGDMDDDGNSDLLFHQKSTGSVSYWLVNATGTGLKSYGAYELDLPVNRNRILGLRDFDNDGRADVLFQNRINGIILYWIQKNISGGTATIESGGIYNVLDRETHFPASPDYFDGYANTPSAPAQSRTTPAAAVDPIMPQSTNQDIKGMVAHYARHSGNGRTEGWYDSYSNRTFFAFAGCASSSATADCYSHPTLDYYNHGTGTWSGAFRVANSPFPVADAHTYSEVLVDNQHRVHVFHSGHGHPLKHWISNETSEFVDTNTTWAESSLGNHISLSRATYVKIFKDKNGHIAVLWRDSDIGTPAPSDPCQLNEYDIEETWFIIGSTNNGNTWTNPQALFDPQKGDTWDTVYLDAVKYDSTNHRLHMTFKLTRFHNCYYDKFYYAYLKLSDMTMRAPTGANLGTSISQSEMDVGSYKMRFHADGEQAWVSGAGGRRPSPTASSTSGVIRASWSKEPARPGSSLVRATSPAS